VLPGDDVLERIAQRTDLDAPLLLDRLFRRHPASTRTMAVLHYVDGMTLEQVARACGVSMSGVRKRLRALRDVLPGRAR
jgi:RNA polymerase sigma-70 factor (ECF subfamily)